MRTTLKKFMLLINLTLNYGINPTVVIKDNRPFLMRQSNSTKMFESHCGLKHPASCSLNSSNTYMA